ncbi:Protein FAR-RED IMPAIRED RESPONSE 1 [Cucumispora dikerogammari]|nr:Protein FAR-RED IMPAIRED RESPONSE 1 [Cucumispora dikerogammari]
METPNRNINEQNLSEEFTEKTEFLTIQEFAEAFSISALEKGIGFVVKQRNKTSISLGCKETPCTFIVRARYVIFSSKCVVKQSYPFHSCAAIRGNQRQPGSLKKVIKNSNVTNLTTRQLVTKMRTEYNRQIPYTTAWSSIQSAKRSSGILLNDSYRFIPCITAKIRENADISTYLCDENGCFKRFFILWNSSKEFFSTSRKLLYLDGTFLTGPNKGTLLVAVSQDACDQLFLISVAIVESENSESWNWFIEQLNISININSPDVIIMSDREMGIINAVNQIAPLCSRAFCVRHIAKNLRSSFRDNIAMGYFWRSVNTYSTDEFNNQMSKLQLHNQPFHQRVSDIGVDKWANSKFPVPRFGKNTNNPAESINSALKKYVSSDITTLIISINNYAMEKFNDRRQKRFQGQLVANCTTILNKNILQGRMLNSLASTSTLFLVEQKYIVNLTNKSCDCIEGNDMGIPCKHVCSVLRNNNLDPISFTSQAYLSEVYYAQYSRNIMPLTTTNLTTSNVLPPITRRARGRPRIRRIRAPHEN